MYKYILMLFLAILFYTKVSLFSRKYENVRSIIPYFGFRQNQSSSQTKEFKYGLVPKILETCERVANIFLATGANFAYM